VQLWIDSCWKSTFDSCDVKEKFEPTHPFRSHSSRRSPRNHRLSILVALWQLPVFNLPCCLATKLWRNFSILRLIEEDGIDFLGNPCTKLKPVLLRINEDRQPNASFQNMTFGFRSRCRWSYSSCRFRGLTLFLCRRMDALACTIRCQPARWQAPSWTLSRDILSEKNLAPSDPGYNSVDYVVSGFKSNSHLYLRPLDWLLLLLVFVTT
jgi:hypothetical protein